MSIDKIIGAGFAAAALLAAPLAHAQETTPDTANGAALTSSETPATIDSNGDGKPDAWDTNGDGRADAWDANGDGKPDQVDGDGDGKPDNS